MDMSKEVIIAASAYESKYYYNDKFNKLPEQIKDDLMKIAVAFVEDVGGIFTIGFYEDGEVYLETQMDEGDLLYDNIGSELNLKRIKKEYEDLFKSLTMWYKLVHLQNTDEGVR